jgi:hypothetical protein
MSSKNDSPWCPKKLLTTNARSASPGALEGAPDSGMAFSFDRLGFTEDDSSQF